MASAKFLLNLIAIASMSIGGILGVSAEVEAAGIPPTPAISGPSQSTGTFTLSWIGDANGDHFYDLMESADGINWSLVMQRKPFLEKTLTRASGTWRYKVSDCYISETGSTPLCSPWSAVKIVTVYAQPGRPMLSCVGCNNPDIDGGAFITWTRPSGTITGYRIYSRRGGGAWSFQLINNASASSHQFPGGSLQDGSWEFKVDACNVLTAATWECSQDSATLTANVIKTPSIPSGISLPSANTNGSVTLSWQTSTGTVSHYEVLRLNTAEADPNYQLVRTVTGSGGAAVPATTTFTGHTDGTYNYRLKACNSASCSAVSDFRQISVLKVPSAPQGLSGPSQSTSGTFALTWSPSTETVDRYDVLRASQQAGGACPSTTSSYVVAGTSAGTSKSFLGHEDGAFCFRVNACNNSGCAASAAIKMAVQKSLDGLDDAVVPNLSIPASDSVGTLVGTSRINGGTVEYSIDIPVPPGRNGMSPKISLDYSGASGAGFIGVGWSLSSGSSSVYRCASIEAIDGRTTPFSGQLSDRLCLNGEQLILVPGSGTYGAAGSKYHPEADPFTTVSLKNGSTLDSSSSFEVVHRDGTLSSYARSRVPARADNRAGYPTHWLLTAIKNSGGNRIDYKYVAGEEDLVDRILYTGFGANEGDRVVVFNYEQRGIRSDGYTPQGFKTTSTQRLSGISTSVSGQAAGFVRLRYEPSLLSGRDLLKGIRYCKDATCAVGTSYPESTFAYTEQAQSFASHTMLADEFSKMVDIGDIDGDGRRDHMLWSRSAPMLPLAAAGIRLSSKLELLPVEEWKSGAPGISMLTPHSHVRDFNSDGRDDLVGVAENGSLMIGIWRVSEQGASLVRLPTNANLGRSSFITAVLDLDRDGDADIIVGDGYTEVALLNDTLEQSSHQGSPSEGDAFPQFRFSTGSLPSSPPNVTFSDIGFMDVSGDGLPDRIYVTSSMGGASDTYVRFGEIDVSGKYGLGELRHLKDDLGGPQRLNEGQALWLDVNGDELQDIYKISNGLSRLWLNTGGRFIEAAVSGEVSFDADLSGGLVVMDYDHDGRDDLLVPTEVAPVAGSTYCYTYYYDVGGEQESEYICSGSGGDSRFEDGNLPDLNRGLYKFDQVKFVQQAAASVSLSQAPTVLSGVIHHSRACDANGDGLSDLCYEQQGEYVRPNHCSPDSQSCVQQVGFGGGPVGTHASLNSRGMGFGIDLLTQAVNGLGYVEQWTYSALSGAGESRCTYNEARPFYSVDPDGAMPGHYHSDANMHVAAMYKASNGVASGMNTKCFRYEDAMFSTKGRGFQGFKAIIEDEALGDGADKSIRTEYYDYYPLTGKPYLVQTKLVADSASYNPLTEHYSEWDYVQRSDGTWHSYLTGKLDVVYNFDAADRPALTRSGVAYEYSQEDLAYGNVTKQSTVTRTLSEAGESQVVNRSEVSFDYDYGSVNSGWYDKLERKTSTMFATVYGSLDGPNPTSESNNDESVVEDFSYYVDGSRRLEKVSVQKGVVGQEFERSFQYDTYGNVKRVTSSAPGYQDRVEVTNYADTYFPNYRIVGGFTSVYDYNVGHGQLESKDEPNGIHIENDYDFAGKVTQTRSNVAQPTHYVSQWCTQGCGSAIFITRVIQAGAPEKVSYVDVLGRTLQSRIAGFESEFESVIDTSYDVRGRMVSESQPGKDAGRYKTQYLDFDALGRFGKKVVDRSGHAMPMQTWVFLRRGLTTDVLLPDGQSVASRTYDASGLLLSTRDPKGATTHHRYDGLGKKVLTANSQGTKIVNLFDALGRKTRTDDPDAGNDLGSAELNSFNGFGELVGSINGNGDETRHQYDVLGRPVLRTVNGLIDARWIYDVDGKPSLTSEETKDADGDGIPDFKRSFDYDEHGRRTATTIQIDGSPKTFVDKLSYDANYGRLKGRMYASGEMVYYKYDELGFLTKELKPWSRPDGGHQQYYTIDAQNARGQIEQISYANGTRGIFTYVDSTGDVEGMLYEKIQTTTAISDYRYYYGDPFGNMTRRESGTDGYGEDFAYDELQRLKSSVATWSGEAASTRSVRYNYDEAGNLIEKSDFGHVYTYGDVDRDNDANAGPHAVVAVSLASGGVMNDFRYDAAGNMIAGNGRLVDYSAFNKPISVSQAGRTTTFEYRPDQELAVRKESGQTIFYGEDYQLVVRGGALVERTFVGQHIVVERAGGERRERFQHHDRLGSLVLVTDEDGEATERHAFDAFGLPLAGDGRGNGGLLHGGMSAERLTEKGYTSHEHLDDHKVVHMGGRMYDPAIGRFMSVDPFVQSELSTQSQNPYSYVMNNPLSMIDPSGYRAICSDELGTSSCVSSAEVVSRPIRDLAKAARHESGAKITNGNGREKQAAKNSARAVSVTGSPAVRVREVSWVFAPHTQLQEEEDDMVSSVINCLDDGACNFVGGAIAAKVSDAAGQAAKSVSTARAAAIATGFSRLLGGVAIYVGAKWVDEAVVMGAWHAMDDEEDYRATRHQDVHEAYLRKVRERVVLRLHREGRLPQDSVVVVRPRDYEILNTLAGIRTRGLRSDNVDNFSRASESLIQEGERLGVDLFDDDAAIDLAVRRAWVQTATNPSGRVYVTPNQQ